MRNARKTVRSLATLVLMFSVAIGAPAQTLSNEAREIGVRWLFGTCELGSPLRDELRKAASPALETFFLEAAQNGPPAGDIAALERAAGQRYAQRQQTFKRPDGLGLTAEDLAEAQHVTREDFIAQERRDFVLRYQSAAVSALGIVGGERARAELERLAADTQSPLRSTALQAQAELAKSR
jgi:hypothetical protein